MLSKLLQITFELYPSISHLSECVKELNNHQDIRESILSNSVVGEPRQIRYILTISQLQILYWLFNGIDELLLPFHLLLSCQQHHPLLLVKPLSQLELYFLG